MPAAEADLYVSIYLNKLRVSMVTSSLTMGIARKGSRKREQMCEDRSLPAVQHWASDQIANDWT